MKTHQDIMNALGDLSDGDRAWIIERLSPAARGTLLHGESAAEKSTRADSSASTQRNEPSAPSETWRKDYRVNRENLASLSAKALAALLSKEPAWIAHAVFSAVDRADVRELLPVELRNEIGLLSGSSIRVSERLSAAIAANLVSETASTPDEQQHSTVRTLFSGIGARLSRQRTGIRT
jgi:hypothetical protein